MSLYRNWRPRSFSDLVGQDAVVRTLSQALSSDRLVHAYLFSGPRGSGKTSAAKIMARCITCVQGPTPTPDNTCDNCRAILDGTALDVVEIDAASNRGIDEIRALRDAVKFAPTTMRRKVYIVDEAHMLTKEGANAFLKTLEEPPEHVVFILATTAPESLPVTILSRCQRFAFRRIGTPVMMDRMRYIAGEEGIEIEDAALGAIAYRADGGLRDALTMLEQASSFAQGAIDVPTIEAAFGSSGRVYAGVLIDAFIAQDALGVIQAIETASDAGTDMSNLMRSLIAELRHIVIARIDGALLEHDLIDEDAARVRERAERLPQVRALRGLRLLADALALARTSGNARLELEAAMLRLTLQGEDPTLEALATRVRQLEDQLTQNGGVNEAPRASASAAKPASPPAAIPSSSVPAATAASVRESAPVRPANGPAAPNGTPVVQSGPPIAPGSPPAAPPGSPAKAVPPKAASPKLPKSNDGATAALDRQYVGSTRDAIAVTAMPADAANLEPVQATRTVGGAGHVGAAYAGEASGSIPAAVPNTAPLASATRSSVVATVEPDDQFDPSFPTAPDDAPGAPADPPTLQRVRSLWPSICARAESEFASLRGPLSRAGIGAVDGFAITLELADEHNAGILRARLAVVERALEQVLGKPCTAGIKVASGTGSRNAKKSTTIPEQAEESLGLLDYAAKRLGAIGDEKPW